MNVRNLKLPAQISMLRSICEQLSKVPDEWLENTAEDLLFGIVQVLDDQSQDNAWSTEGWKHFFGQDD